METKIPVDKTIYVDKTELAKASPFMAIFKNVS